MKFVDIARSPGSGIGAFTSSKRLANQLKINEISEVRQFGEEDLDELSENWISLEIW